MPRIVDTSASESNFPAVVQQQIAVVAENSESKKAQLWTGPRGDGKFGGVTQSMCQNYLVCRERFRVKYLLGLKAFDTWDKKFGYGNMWHVCEEAHAKKNADLQDDSDWKEKLTDHTREEMRKYPMQRPEIGKWDSICRVQFPEYVKHWSSHPDVLDRTPLMQEQVFDIPYKLPSGRSVRLRGKFDSVDLIQSQGGIFQQENKTKGDIDEQNLQRQLKFDLQTLLYHTALEEMQKTPLDPKQPWFSVDPAFFKFPICGVRYNVVRRPFSGGKGSIQQHKAKVKKGRVYKRKPSTPDEFTPAETDAEFYERLRRDYIAEEPEYWFFRLMCRISDRDVAAFRRQCLEPILENMLDDYEWWAWCIKKGEDHWDSELRSNLFPIHTQRHFRFPFGVFNALTEIGYTEFDEYLETGIEAGLRRVDTLFTELQ